jgi:hypothetical protein
MANADRQFLMLDEDGKNTLAFRSWYSDHVYCRAGWWYFEDETSWEYGPYSCEALAVAEFQRYIIEVLGE